MMSFKSHSWSNKIMEMEKTEWFLGFGGAEEEGRDKDTNSLTDKGENKRKG